MANLTKELLVTTEDKPGIMARVMEAVKNAGINITGICAWAMEGKGNILLITDDPGKAKSAIEGAGFSAKDQEAVTLNIPNRVGALAEIGEKLGRAEINIQYCYLSAVGDSALAILGTENNQKAVEILA